MSISSISLTASQRSNLSALKKTSNQLSTTEEHLSTGKKVDSALDNATEYFGSRGFLNKANDLSNLKDSLATSLETVKSATNSIDSVASLVEQLKAITTSALQTTDTASRDTYATQYNSLMAQVDFLISDATFNGTNLLDGTANLLVYFNETNSTTLTVSGVNATSAGLGIVSAGNRFQTNSDIQTATSLLQTAINTLRSESAQFGNTTTVILTRQDFTDNMIATLEDASDNLILADTNEESANLTTLQTRNQLAVISLSISSTAQQAILKLF